MSLVQGGLGVPLVQAVRSSHDSTLVLGLVSYVLRPTFFARLVIEDANRHVMLSDVTNVSEPLFLAWTGPGGGADVTDQDMALMAFEKYNATVEDAQRSCRVFEVAQRNWIMCQVVSEEWQSTLHPFFPIGLVAVCLVVGTLLCACAVTMAVWLARRARQSKEARRRSEISQALLHQRELTLLNVGHELRTPLTSIALATAEMQASSVVCGFCFSIISYSNPLHPSNPIQSI